MPTAASTGRAFFATGGPRVATARAGNVIGGGDWAEDRLLPDAMRAFEGGRAVRVRNPASVRPWQHVLEPLAGYLMLAERLCDGGDWTGGWNFGPREDDAIPVAALVELALGAWGDGRWEAAYDSPRTITVPSDLEARLVKSAKARRAFEKLDSRNRYAILYRLHHAKRADTRQRRLDQFVAMLEAGRTIH